jgi:hypothetical protein
VRRVAGIVAIAIAAFAWGSEEAAAASPLHLTTDARGLSWQDEPGASTYHVSGTVTYWPRVSCSAGGYPPPFGERVPFDEMLGAHSVRFDWPAPQDTRLTLRKEGVFNIQALDSSGNALAGDGFAFEVDPTCTPDEIAAAGTGFRGARPGVTTWLTGLFAFGWAALAGGLLLKRRAV